MIIKILSVQFLKFLRGLLVKSIDFVHRGFRVRVSLDVNEGQLLNELLLHGFTSFLPPIFYHGWGEGDKTNVRVTENPRPGRGRERGVRGMEVEKKPTAPAGQERERVEEVGNVTPEKMNTYLEKIKKGQSTMNGIRQELGLPPINEGDLLLKKRN